MGYELLVRFGMWAVLILGAAGAIWWGAATIHDNIYEDGVNAERVIWQQREAKEATERNNKILEIQNKLRKAEREHAERIVEIDQKYTQEAENAEKQKALDIAAARAGSLKLRWTSESEGRGDGGGATGDIARATAICNDQKGGELPAEITANLYALVDDADRNTKQLGACQAIVESDRAKKQTILIKGNDP